MAGWLQTDKVRDRRITYSGSPLSMCKEKSDFTAAQPVTREVTRKGVFDLAEESEER